MRVFCRREFLRELVSAAFLVCVPIALEVSDAAAAMKISKDQVHYRMVGWNRGRNCMNCRFFQPAEGGMCMGMMDARCRLVAGSISPMAYCDLFAPFRPGA
jgi:hypothetical protein